MQATDNLRVRGVARLKTPAELQREIPLTDRGSATVSETRAQVRSILAGKDPRLVVVVGPCSIHDVAAAREYAVFISRMRRRFSERILILMRVYFEKPRTTVGWKGLLNDPHLDGSYDVEAGLQVGRALMVELAEQGVPSASEVLDPIVPQYLSDAIAWAAIGARTIESQTHREMTSGLSMPVGLKNGTDGTFDVALNAMKSAEQPHHFLGIDRAGQVAVVATAGNPDTHLVLRGGASGPNHDENTVRKASAELTRRNLCPRVMIDCSHGNSNKDYQRQPLVAADIADLVKNGAPVFGAMLESNLVAGTQPFPPSAGTPLRYGQSITDGCIDLLATENALAALADAAETRR